MVCLVAVLAASCKPPPPKRTLSVALSAQHFEGSNGVHVYTIPDRGAELVGFHVRYGVGSTDDPPGKEGLAHLVEHLMFSRTLKFGDRVVTIGTRLDEIALESNAYTRFDHTHYYAIAPEQHLGELFALETVRIAGGCDAIDQANFEREREVVRNEIRQRSAGDFGLIRPALLARVYRQHPYARPVGGSDRSLRSITRADVCRFIEAHYSPSKVKFYVVGAVDPLEVRRAAAKWLGRIPPRPNTPPPPRIPRPEIEPRLERVTLDVEEPYILFAWRVPVEHQAYPLLGRVVAALEGRMGSFSLTYDLGGRVDASIWGGAQAPILVLSVALRDLGKLGETVGFMEKAAAGVEVALPREDYDETRVDMFDARSWAAEALLASFETLSGRGLAFADLGDRSGGKRFLVEAIQAIDALDAGPLREMGSAMTDPDRAVRLYVSPSGSVAKRHSGGAVAINHQSDRWRVRADPAEASRPLALPAARRRAEIEDYRLDNGLRVILAQSGDLPIVRLRLLYAVGQIHEPADLAGLASFAAAFQGRFVDEDFTRDTIRALNTRTDYQIMSLASDWGGGFDQILVEKLRGQLARDLREPLAASRRHLRVGMRRHLYGAEHPYTVHAWIDPERLGAMDQSDLRGLIRRYYGGRNATLIVAGRFDTDLMKDYIERRRAEPPPAAAATAGPGVVPASHAGATQLELRVAFRTPAGIDEHHPARLVAASILRGRLRALREERGITYGASVEVVPRAGPGQYAVVVRVDPGRAAEAVTALRATLAGLRASPAAALATDFVAARRQVARGLLLERSRPDLVIEQLDFAARFGLPLSYRGDLAGAVARVEIEEVAKLIRDELGEARQVLGIHGPPQVVEVAVAAARAPLQPTAPPEPTSEAPAEPIAPEAGPPQQPDESKPPAENRSVRSGSRR